MTKLGFNILGTTFLIATIVIDLEIQIPKIFSDTPIVVLLTWSGWGVARDYFMAIATAWAFSLIVDYTLNTTTKKPYLSLLAESLNKFLLIYIDQDRSSYKYKGDNWTNPNFTQHRPNSVDEVTHLVIHGGFDFRRLECACIAAHYLASDFRNKAQCSLYLSPAHFSKWMEITEIIERMAKQNIIIDWHEIFDISKKYIRNAQSDTDIKNNNKLEAEIRLRTKEPQELMKKFLIRYTEWSQLDGCHEALNRNLILHKGQSL